MLFSSALFGIQVASVVKLQSDEFVIGASLPVRAVSPYSIARKLSGLPGQLTSQFVFVLLPLASRMHAEGDASMLREIYLSGMRLTLALFAIVGGALIIFAHPFLVAWLPAAASSTDIVVLLTFAALLEAMISPVSQALQGMSRHQPLVVFALGSAALNLALSIALIGPLGVRGVAIGTLVATAVEAAIVLPFGARVLDVRAADIVRRVLIPGLVPLIPTVAVLVVIHSTLAPASIPAIAVAGLAGALVYSVGYLALPATAGERALARRLLALGRGVLSR
jgi:O-antigen/teichoic acid export membrane protein